MAPEAAVQADENNCVMYALKRHAAKATVLDEGQILGCVMDVQFLIDQKTGKHRSHTSRDSTIPI